MRKLLTLMLFVCLAVLVIAPVAQATDSHDRDVLGSGAEIPDKGEVPELPPAPEAPPVAAVPVAQPVSAEQLAQTGFDSMAALLLGIGLTGAGGAALWVTRRRPSA